ncbi:ImmA/IrrE family metallo-endopeptidase [Corynebacterium uberis]|uniref:ImmA/IrrE family metallo-endopeptidase n=1 Tax=Corynebacterium TaxID=1716 RepID=UPI001D0B5159|nr:ImmA/IrrE family metallo-endopeptidase [Corynebacterium uberis]MCZ9310100.1 ImmA/IrrE family metallo-endopeptidase [Corynebacterium sp. c6VSa_13]UDL73243.1 ImmA/IrrE family metallo-endopeptidase [Corynebacterium uberis]UDL78092.1 ImmA/IrrE family metallo-endopeptidase [Corynebacterium uberis]UDL82510.1 ImmA/IrrE family metallo-endopeptidase [Corynebacterium uberis]UDL84717.1 ImmA/IrrE family metallo-endopeptidase [Corynebacterium uberis]
MVTVSITPKVLAWAIDRTRLSDEELSKKFPRLDAWIDGSARPTFNQAQKLAQSAQVPFGYLLLENPAAVADQIQLPDFRTVRGSGVSKPSPELIDTINHAEFRLGWYAEYAEEHGIEGPNLLEMSNLDSDPAPCAREVRNMFGWPSDKPVPGPNKLKTLVTAMEDHGLLVMRNSIVEHSTKRPLDIHEFRGFTLRDGNYGLVFINTRDTVTAQLFSLAHELGHIVCGQPGLSGSEQSSTGVERWCNLFAGELLMPGTAILQQSFDESDLGTTVANTAKQFGASREALLWRLVDLDIISRPIATQLISQLQPATSSRTPSNGGPSFAVLTRHRMGDRFTSTVMEAATNGLITQKTAAGYLGIKTRDSFQGLANLMAEAV